MIKLKMNLYNRLKGLANSNETLTDEEVSNRVHNIIQEEILDNDYDANIIRMEETLKLLDEAMGCDNDEMALEYSKKAYKLSPDVFACSYFMANLEKSLFTSLDIINKALKEEKERLIQQEKEDLCSPSFMDKLPYINGLSYKARILAKLGRLRQAKDICLEVMSIDPIDINNMYSYLLAIYVCLEENEEFLHLSKKYKDKGLCYLIPMFIYNFKQSDDKNAINYLKKIYKKNNYIFTFFDKNIDYVKDIELDENTKFIGENELILYFRCYYFLIESTPGIYLYLKENKSKVIK